MPLSLNATRRDVSSFVTRDREEEEDGRMGRREGKNEEERDESRRFNSRWKD